ncbi:MAG: LTA synthase family protein, partial [Clostridiaceae bacterium]|nr:LTA synthase family protein [Clostridiaceae bacterium]
MRTAIEKANNTVINLVNQFSLLEVIYIIIFILSVFTKCIFLLFQCRISFLPLFNKTNIYMAISTLSFALILTAFMIIVYTKRKIPFLIMNFVVSLILFADAMYFRYYNTIISVPVIYYIKYLGDIGGSAVSLLRISDILYFIDIPLFILFSFIFSKRESRTITYVERMILALLVIMVGFAGFKTAYHNSDVSTYDNNYLVKNLGISYFHYFDIKRYIKENILRNSKLSSAEENEIRAFFSSREKEAESTAKKYSGIAKGKNLIIVQVEALQQFVIDSRINGREITPSLISCQKKAF